MKSVLADTSVWVDHFRRGNEALIALLALDLVVTHPLVVGEIACGTLARRARALADLQELRCVQQAHVGEVLAFIERENLSGSGCGVVDMLLLASTLMTPGVALWTLDKRLAALAARFGVQHQPALH